MFTAIADSFTILSRTVRRIGSDNLSALAAAAAFYALLSLFPTLTAVVSLYGLVADPNTVEQQISATEGILPPEAVKLIATWLETLAQGPPAKFGIGLIVSVLLAFWSASSATGMLMSAINTCYGEKEQRSLIRFNLHAYALTAGLTVFALLALALVAVLPVALDLLPVPTSWRDVINLLRWPILAVIVMIAIDILYSHAPPGRLVSRWRWISWGSAVATALWVLGSATFTIYVTKLGSYDRTYGSLGAVIVLLLWLYLSAFVVLIGAELNAERERHLRKKGLIGAA